MPILISFPPSTSPNHSGTRQTHTLPFPIPCPLYPAPYPRCAPYPPSPPLLHDHMPAMNATCLPWTVDKRRESLPQDSKDPRRRLSARVARECSFCSSTESQSLLTCGACQSATHVQCYFTMESDHARHYTTHPSDWRCQDCGGPQRDRMEERRRRGPDDHPGKR